jgi:hypothetical protein
MLATIPTGRVIGKVTKTKRQGDYKNNITIITIIIITIIINNKVRNVLLTFTRRSSVSIFSFGFSISTSMF